MRTIRCFTIAVVIACAIGTALLLAGCRTEATPEARGASVDAPSVERVVGGLQEPVALVFLSPEVMLVAERRSGRIRWIEGGVLRPAPFATVSVPNLSGYHEYGLLGLAVARDYPRTPYVYVFHTVGDGNRATEQRIVRFTVHNRQGVEPTTIVDNLPAGTLCCHNGGRLLAAQDGSLFVTLGDTQRQELAQNYEALPGKILRFTPDGTPVADNPLEEPRTGWAGTPGGDAGPLGGQRTAVYAIGIRNAFGIAQSPATGDIFFTDNGPQNGDELNRLVAGDNYGWPEVGGMSDDARFRQPLWTSGKIAVAPTGMAFYDGAALPQYRGNLFFASYNDGQLRRVVFRNRDSIESISIVPAAGRNARLDVAMSPDGHLYFSSLDAIYRLR